jgi:hypothetical protein
MGRYLVAEEGVDGECGVVLVVVAVLAEHGGLRWWG